MNKITISGYAGAGKSHVGEMLAEKLGCEFLSVGNMTREIAEKEYGMSINEFQDKCRVNPQLDDEINLKFAERCNNAENVVADFRLGFHFVKNSFNILLTVSDKAAFERLSKAERGKEKTDFESIKERNREMRGRFLERFGVDFADKNNYHLVIDTSEKTPEETLSLILDEYTKIVFSEEDELVADIIKAMPIMSYYPFNKEMLPYFIFYYKRAFPELEKLGDLDNVIESFNNLFEDIKYKNINALNGKESGLYNGYRDYPRLYCYLLVFGVQQHLFANKIGRVCYKIRKYIYENERTKLACDIKRMLEDKQEYEYLEGVQVEFQPRELFSRTPRNVAMLSMDSTGAPHPFEEEVMKKRFSDEPSEPLDGVGDESSVSNTDSNVKSNATEDLHSKTKKELCEEWDVVLKSDDPKCYADILNDYGERFSMKFLRKEISKRNKHCIEGIQKSHNAKAIRFLFAVLWNGIVLGKDETLAGIKDAISQEFICSEHTHSSRNGIVKRIVRIPQCAEDLGYECYPSKLYTLYIYAIFYSKDKHIQNTYDLCNINYEFSNCNENLYDILYEMLAKDNVLSRNLKNIIGYSFYHNTFENYYDPNFDSGHMNDYLNLHIIYSVLMSWSKNEKIELEKIDKYNDAIPEGFDTCSVLRPRARIILNANYVVPKYSEENVKRVRQLLYPSITFHKYWVNKAKERDIVNLTIVEKIVLWKEYWKEVIVREQLDIYNQLSTWQSHVSLPIEREYEEYLLSRSDDIFATGVDTLMVHEFKVFVFEERKKNIDSLKKDGFLDDKETDALMQLAKETDYYGFSCKDIESCLSEKKDETWWNTIYTRIESEFMSHIFERCLLWVVTFDKSELWDDAPWWGMKIFSKSFEDRPSVWAKHLLNLLNVELSEMELLRVCFALGDLREPLGGEVPKKLKMLADKYAAGTRGIILRQHRRFNRGNLKRGRYSGNEKKRVKKCREMLLSISQYRFL